MAYRKLNCNTGKRRALLRNMTTALLKNGRIETTEPKAKELRSIVEKMITLGKQGDLQARRQVAAYLLDEDVVKDLFDNLSKKYTDRQGGYTRIIKVGTRRGDAAPIVIIELV
ncbi:MAG: 50S ribosomal protein L17 [Clostridia bacterium]|jgi:large subunit ribosomal protein L17|nr:50S ribosomal protein L17 [Clostridia bacterium]MDD4145736.1 50S ribosomal protein L17 [Clostridia bacterium]MDD4665280.1 50S ribosomal protein L17 [Clostridia bacterium]